MDKSLWKYFLRNPPDCEATMYSWADIKCFATIFFTHMEAYICMYAQCTSWKYFCRSLVSRPVQTFSTSLPGLSYAHTWTFASQPKKLETALLSLLKLTEPGYNLFCTLWTFLYVLGTYKCTYARHDIQTTFKKPRFMPPPPKKKKFVHCQK
jgi:hypothetical protein